MYEPELFALEGQVAVVTGAAAGIGRAIAEGFAGAGASVIVSDLDPAAAQAVAGGIEDRGGKAVARACDVTKEETGGGAMLAVTSMAGENKNERMASYASSKAATNHLIRNIAFDLGPRGIRVNGVAPGATKTDALRSVLTNEIEEKMLRHTPIKRLGEPEDIANAALFLCSPAASWISGQVLTVSGGGVQELN